MKQQASLAWLKRRSKTLRAEMTPHERIIWNLLRTGELRALYWRHQSALGVYILDFVSHSAKLIVEIDGSQHAKRKQLEHDTKRTSWLNAQGYRVIRFWNCETKAAQNEIWLTVHAAAAQTPAHMRMQRWRATDQKSAMQANANLPLDGGGGREAAGGGDRAVNFGGSNGKYSGPHPLSRAPRDSSPIEGERE